MPETKRGRPRTGAPQESGHHKDQLDLIDTVPAAGDDEWRRRLAERIAQSNARRDRARAERAVLAARRAAGLRSRHAGKLRRGGGR